jgi:ribosomal protein S18 acetylase RimI-like enzyme
MSIEFKLAPPEFAAEYIRLRGLTRENAVSEDRLRSLGITAETWANDIRSNALQGFISQSGQELVGYCFGDTRSGEVVVLAVSPTHESQGVGRRLLALVIEQLGLLGHERLFLGCSSDPKVRSYGFYRHLGWRSTGTVDERGDEVLELLQQ